MKNDVYQPTATDNLTNDENVEIMVRDKGSSISVVWRFVLLIFFFLVIALMIALIIVSKKVARLQANQCPIPTTIAPGTTAATGWTSAVDCKSHETSMIQHFSSRKQISTVPFSSGRMCHDFFYLVIHSTGQLHITLPNEKGKTSRYFLQIIDSLSRV